ncbi:metalloprotease [Aquimarina sp. 2201CG5-10]|uniref:metalloprotease n=1 Tax=Aquimarina callyspongiae TaxID=3098150 RepID=UPI002AB4584A|nr:metalloprotease [Aquimarina sp. 2201CG5-10]MDY8135681.1 metalloprotease [Aquimarina sp. 2201CG5-10]
MKTNKISHIILVFFVLNVVSAQHNITIDGILDSEAKTITIDQKIVYTNTSDDTLSEIFLHDWANSFSSKTTPLGERFSEDFLKRFYYAKDHERGATAIESISDTNSNTLFWERYNDIQDIIKIPLTNKLNPGDQYTILLKYKVKIPSDKFTRYGYHNNGNYSLRYWHIVPAVYDTKWNIYSNKNLDDQYTNVANYNINISIPSVYNIYTDLQKETISESENTKLIQLTGKNRNTVELYLEKQSTFYAFPANGVQFISNIEDNDLLPAMKSVATTRIIKFLEKRLGPYPFEKILVSESDYKNNPVYGLNQLPDILRPFPDGFQYEIKQLKTITENYLEKTILINPKYDSWIRDAIHIYLMMAYTEQYYPDMKIVGNLSKIIGVRWFHASELEFNDQYFLAYKNIARLFLDQPLNTPNDELVKFNANIANAYKAGVGFKYLEDYLEDDNIVTESIKTYYDNNKLKLTSSEDYREILTSISPKSVDWFFEDYVSTKEQMDFKIKSVKKGKDSIEVTVKNLQNNSMPVSLYGLRDDTIISKTWVTNINGSKKVTIANDNLDKLALDYDQNIPEVNRRNNYRNLKWILNRPIQFRFLQDVEDPKYSQIFFIPEFEFNVYDGFTIGSKFYNKTIIRRQFDYKITPFYGLKSNKLLGSVSFTYRHQIADHGLYQIRYGASGNMFSYAPDLLFKRFSPNINFFYRSKDLRSNKRQRLSIRSVNVFRDRDENNPVSTPDYSVFNVRHRYSDFNLTDFKSYLFDYQIAKNFSKISTTINYRKLFLNNRQLNLRLFAGAFIFNDTEKDGDFFSFALDRPTDYLFDYNYLGRSEDTGLTSQQIIIAEGGFKSQLKYPFANEWITTFNANTNIWNWIYAYGDIGLVKNRGISPKFVYDAGVRLSLVADYFEVFFPVVSNKGWEIAQPNYDEQIRFIITLSPETLIGLFTREWY